MGNVMKRRKVVQPLDWPIPSLHKPDYEYELGYEVSQAMFRPPVQPIHSHRPQQRGFSADSELSKIYTELWVLDKNRLEPEIHYHIDIQEDTAGTKNHCDQAKNPLFSDVDEEVLQQPTYCTFIKLLDNYEKENGVAEVVTPEEKKENQDFLDRCMETKLMKRAHQYLVLKQNLPRSEDAFKCKLYKLWFELYKRTGENDSSGFEHVFVGETRDKTVIGFHNWIQFYLQEKAGNVNYQGYIQCENGPKPRLLTIKFTWKDQVKPIGSSFIGTSPEFELALYTILYFCRNEEETYVTIAGHKVVLKCIKKEGHLTTCYPKLPDD